LHTSESGAGESGPLPKTERSGRRKRSKAVSQKPLSQITNAPLSHNGGKRFLKTVPLSTAFVTSLLTNRSAFGQRRKAVFKSGPAFDRFHEFRKRYRFRFRPLSRIPKKRPIPLSTAFTNSGKETDSAFHRFHEFKKRVRFRFRPLSRIPKKRPIPLSTAFTILKVEKTERRKAERKPLWRKRFIKTAFVT
jgi:hypothetical protein